MNIFEELSAEHDKVSELLTSLEDSGPDEATLGTLKSELTAHAEAEEQVFYKRLETEDETKDIVAEGYKEHKEIARALGVLNPGARGGHVLDRPRRTQGDRGAPRGGRGGHPLREGTPVAERG